MLYTVSELSDLISLSKVSIYKKLKLNEDVKSDLNNKDIESSGNEEAATDTDDLTINTELVKTLIEQLKAKDEQITALNDRLEKSKNFIKIPRYYIDKNKRNQSKIYYY